MTEYVTVHLVREHDILTVQVNASAPAEAAQMLGRYIHADVYITADERGVCTAQRAIAQELLGDANEKAQRASQIMASAAQREQDINRRETVVELPKSLAELAKQKRIEAMSFTDSSSGLTVELSDEPGRIVKLTGPNSVSSPGVDAEQALAHDQAVREGWAPLVLCGERTVHYPDDEQIDVGPCVLAEGHDGFHVDEEGERWTRD